MKTLQKHKAKRMLDLARLASHRCFLRARR